MACRRPPQVPACGSQAARPPLCSPSSSSLRGNRTPSKHAFYGHAAAVPGHVTPSTHSTSQPLKHAFSPQIRSQRHSQRSACRRRRPLCICARSQVLSEVTAERTQSASQTPKAMRCDRRPGDRARPGHEFGSGSQTGKRLTTGAPFAFTFCSFSFHFRIYCNKETWASGIA